MPHLSLQQFLFPHCRVKNQNCRKLKCDLSKHQEKNRNPMEKELAESDLPVKRNIPNTIQKYHISSVFFLNDIFVLF